MNSRLILVPQFPIKMRYQEWWFDDFEDKLSYYFDDIIKLGKDSDLLKKYEHENLGELFSSPELSMKFEFEQIQEYYNMELYDNDILLLLDISFPGFFPHVIYHKRPPKAFAFCHATSVNNLDYFEPINFKYDDSKADSESALFKLFDKVFVSSEYHKDKLLTNDFPDNIISLGALPNPPDVEKFEHNNKYDFDNRENKIVSVSRPSEQKVNINIEKFVEKEYETKIIRPQATTWKQYYDFLRNSKVLLLTGKEDTYGYSIIDAYLCGCNVVAPIDFAYPELLNKYVNLYKRNSLDSIVYCLNENLKRHMFNKLLNHNYIKRFYDNLAQYMME